MDKRQLAKAHRGVWYDPRIDKFVAEIYIDGVRTPLGSYREIGEASAAYTQAAVNRTPIHRTDEPGFSDLVGENPEPGLVVEHRGQEYRFVRQSFRRIRGRTLPFYEWLSDCATCGAEYETMTSASGARSATRNCKLHTKKWISKPKVAFDFTPLVDQHEVLYGDIERMDRRFLQALMALKLWTDERAAWQDYALWKLRRGAI